MSNSSAEVKRIIQIRQIQRQIDEDENSYEDTIQSQLSKLNEAKEELFKLEEQKKLLHSQTENQIQKLRDDWEQEKLELAEQAKEQGYEEGFNQGKEDSISQYQHLIEEANSITISARKDYEATVEKNEETILNLAIQVAEKIIKKKLAEDPESFLPIVKEAINDIKDQRVLSIYLSPKNYAFVLAQKSELERILDKKTELSIYVNESLEQGSCVIEHPFGKVDASVDTQLSQIQQVLHEIVMENRE
ncbi:flagellar assembly protein FliH [Ornithinibacillus xuwenensis]|uniref:Flagellar assembly protein FliH n=1 Tax=Ornithinibacillus xuwenensis TaxID=3144668 RepID=A0ABU9XEJ5_9BACI